MGSIQQPKILSASTSTTSEGKTITLNLDLSSQAENYRIGQFVKVLAGSVQGFTAPDFVDASSINGAAAFYIPLNDELKGSVDVKFAINDDGMFEGSKEQFSFRVDGTTIETYVTVQSTSANQTDGGNTNGSDSGTDSGSDGAGSTDNTTDTGNNSDGSSDTVTSSGGGGGATAPLPTFVEYAGTDANDLKVGSSGDDVLRGLGGDDGLDGSTGNDFINGNAGNDFIIGNLGDDILKGGSENDVLRGGAGNDFTNGNRGNDIVSGGDGNDVVRGGSEDDIVYGGAGNDRVYGDLGNDQLFGQAGADIFYLSAGNDIVQDFELGVDAVDGTAVTGITFTFVEDGALATYDGGSTLFVGVDAASLV